MRVVDYNTIPSAARSAAPSCIRRRRRAPRQMYSATCSNCGKEARVPFQPRGDKPVYCSDCFQQMGGGARSGSRGSGEYGSNW